MKFEVTRIYTLENDGPTKAFCDLTIDGQITVKGFRVVEGRNGLFAGYPREGKDGKWFLQAFPVTDDAKEKLNEAVLKAYAGQRS